MSRQPNDAGPLFMLEIADTFFTEQRAAWREWLKKHHGTRREIWLLLFKKHVDGRDRAVGRQVTR